MKVLKLSSKFTSLYLLLCVFSLLLVVSAPSTYSYGYVLFIHYLYLATALFSIFRNKKDGCLSFNFIFSVSYYFVNFVYPVFYYPTADRYFGLFSYEFDESLISKCTALAYFAYCVYLYGYISYSGKKVRVGVLNEVRSFNMERIANVSTILLIIVFVLFLFSGGLNAFSVLYQEADHVGGISSYLFELVYCFSLVTTITSFYSKKLELIPLAVVIFVNFIVLMTGFRTFTICWLIALLALINDRINTIKLPVLLAVSIGGLVFFNTIRIVRDQDFTLNTVYEVSKTQMEGNVTESGHPVLDNAWDLIINNRSLYYLVGFADNNGHTYGVTLLGGILGVVPMGQTVFVNITGIPIYLLGSATFNTVMSAGPNSRIGLGTNSVADLYLPFGIIGVIIGFFFMGRILRICYEKKDMSIYYSFAYYCLIYRALFIPRSSVLMSLRVIVWTMIIFYFINIFVGKKKTIVL